MMLLGTLLAFLSLSTSGAAVSEPSPGQISRLTCAASSEHSYTIYLPSSYNDETSWPLLLAYDPGAVGERPVVLFEAAAEQFGYIVAASNDSRNYTPWDDKIAAAAAVWKDVAARFRIDSNRVYTTGFSGGARLATEIALQTEAVAGVFVHGGGFREQARAERGVPFVLVGAAGHHDMNLREIEQIHRALIERGQPSRMFVFDGGHRWAPEEINRRALAWFELHAVRAEHSERSTDWIGRQFARGVEEAQLAGETFQGLAAYEQLLDDFESLVPLDAIAAERDRLAQRATVRRERKAVERRQKVEDRRRNELAQMMRRVALSADDDLAQRAAFRSLAAKIRQLTVERRGKSAAKVALAQRLTLFVSTIGYERAEYASIEGRWREAESFQKMALLAAPELPGLHFRLAESYARQRKVELAIDALNRALEFGFVSAERLASSEAFRALNENESFIAILKRLSVATDSSSDPPK